MTISAAHCATRKFSEVPLPLKDMKIILGKFHRSYGKFEEGEQRRGVRHIEVHPEYNHNTLESDIALVFLDEVSGMFSSHLKKLKNFLAAPRDNRHSAPGLHPKRGQTRGCASW